MVRAAKNLSISKKKRTGHIEGRKLLGKINHKSSQPEDRRSRKRVPG